MLSPLRSSGMVAEKIEAASPSSSLSSAIASRDRASAPCSPQVTSGKSDTPLSKLYSNGLFCPPLDGRDDGAKGSHLAPQVGFVTTRRKAAASVPQAQQSPMFFRTRHGEEFTPPSTMRPGQLCSDTTSPQHHRYDDLLNGLTAPPKNPESVYAYRQRQDDGEDLVKQFGEESCINPMAFLEGGDWESFARAQRPAAAMAAFSSSHDVGGGTITPMASEQCAESRLQVAQQKDTVLVAKSGRQLATSAGKPIVARAQQTGKKSPVYGGTTSPVQSAGVQNGAFAALMTSEDPRAAQEVAKMLWSASHAPPSAHKQTHGRNERSSSEPMCCPLDHGCPQVPASESLESPSAMGGHCQAPDDLLSSDKPEQQNPWRAQATVSRPANVAVDTGSYSNLMAEPRRPQAESAGTVPASEGQIVATSTSEKGYKRPVSPLDRVAPSTHLGHSWEALHVAADNNESCSDCPESMLLGGLDTCVAPRDDGFLHDRLLPEPGTELYLNASRLPAAPSDNLLGNVCEARSPEASATPQVPGSRLPKVSQIWQTSGAHLVLPPQSAAASVSIPASVPETGLLESATLPTASLASLGATGVVPAVHAGRNHGNERDADNVACRAGHASQSVSRVDAKGVRNVVANLALDNRAATVRISGAVSASQLSRFSTEAPEPSPLLSAADLATAQNTGEADLPKASNDGSISLAHSPNSPAATAEGTGLSACLPSNFDKGNAGSLPVSADEAMLLRTSLTDVVTAPLSQLGLHHMKAERQRDDVHEDESNITLRPTVQLLSSSQAGSSLLGSPCTWMPLLDDEANVPLPATPINSPALAPFPVPESIRIRQQEQHAASDGLAREGVATLPAQSLPPSPQHCASPRSPWRRSQLNLPTFKRPSDSDSDVALLQMPGRALVRVAQRLLACKSMPMLPRVPSPPTSPQALRAGSLKPLGKSPCSRADLLKPIAFPWRSLRQCEAAASPSYGSGPLRPVNGQQSVTRIPRVTGAKSGSQLSMNISYVKQDGSHTFDNGAAKENEGSQESRSQHNLKVPGLPPPWEGELRSLTPRLLDDLDNTDFSPVMAQVALYDADRAASPARPLKPQSSVQRTGTLSPGRRTLRPVHVTPPQTEVGSTRPAFQCSEASRGVQPPRPAASQPVPFHASVAAPRVKGDAAQESQRGLCTTSELCIRTPTQRVLDACMQRTPCVSAGKGRISCAPSWGSAAAPLRSGHEAERVQALLDCVCWFVAFLIASSKLAWKHARASAADLQHRPAATCCLVGALLAIVGLLCVAACTRGQSNHAADMVLHPPSLHTPDARSVQQRTTALVIGPYTRPTADFSGLAAQAGTAVSECASALCEASPKGEGLTEKDRRLASSRGRNSDLGQGLLKSVSAGQVELKELNPSFEKTSVAGWAQAFSCADWPACGSDDSQAMSSTFVPLKHGRAAPGRAGQQQESAPEKLVSGIGVAEEADDGAMPTTVGIPCDGPRPVLLPRLSDVRLDSDSGSGSHTSFYDAASYSRVDRYTYDDDFEEVTLDGENTRAGINLAAVGVQRLGVPAFRRSSQQPSQPGLAGPVLLGDTSTDSSLPLNLGVQTGRRYSMHECQEQEEESCRRPEASRQSMCRPRPRLYSLAKRRVAASQKDCDHAGQDTLVVYQTRSKPWKSVTPLWLWRTQQLVALAVVITVLATYWNPCIAPQLRRFELACCGGLAALLEHRRAQLEAT